MVRCGDRKIYTGISTDVARRFEEHQGSVGKGAKFLRGRGPLELLVRMRVGSRSKALRAEWRIKRLRKSQKEAIIRDPSVLRSLIGALPKKHRSITVTKEGI